MPGTSRSPIRPASPETDSFIRKGSDGHRLGQPEADPEAQRNAEDKNPHRATAREDVVVTFSPTTGSHHWTEPPREITDSVRANARAFECP